MDRALRRLTDISTRRKHQGKKFTGPPYEGDVSLGVVIHAKTRHRRDLDNVLKVIGDSITNAGVILDDSQIQDIKISRKFGCQQDEAEIRVWAM